MTYLNKQDNQEKSRARLFVSGHVQGVFFRASTRAKAKQLELTGWVKNLEGGEVEAVFEGKKENVDELIKWARRNPGLSRIDKLKISEEPYKGEFEEFKVKF